MADEGLWIDGVRRGKRHTTTTVFDPVALRRPGHVERRWGLPGSPGARWVADLIYVWNPSGFCCVSFVTGVFSRWILGWWSATSKGDPAGAVRAGAGVGDPTTDQPRARHQRAAAPQGRRELVTSLAFTQAPAGAGITGSVGTTGDALDNVLTESMTGLFETEVIFHERDTWHSWRQVEQATTSRVYWHNHQRLHPSLSDIPPAEHEQNYHHSTAGHDESVAV